MQYLAAASGLTTLLFGLRARLMPQTHFRGLGIESRTPQEIIAARAGAHAIGARTVVMGALLLLSAYEGRTDTTGWLMLGMTAVMYVDGAATKQAIADMEREEREKGGKLQRRGAIGKEWLHWSSLPLFGVQALLYLRKEYGWF